MDWRSEGPREERSENISRTRSNVSRHDRSLHTHYRPKFPTFVADMRLPGGGAWLPRMTRNLQRIDASAALASAAREEDDVACCSCTQLRHCNCTPELPDHFHLHRERHAQKESERHGRLDDEIRTCPNQQRRAPSMIPRTRRWCAHRPLSDRRVWVSRIPDCQGRVLLGMKATSL